MTCANDPSVIYPDGLNAARIALDPGRASAGGSPYETYSHERCEQSGPILSCVQYDGPPEAAVEMSDYAMTITSGPRGSFALTLDGRTLLASRLLRS